MLGGRKTPLPQTAAKIVTALRGNDDDARQARMLAEHQGELHRYQRRQAVGTGAESVEATVGTAPVVAPPISGLPRARIRSSPDASGSCDC